MTKLSLSLVILLALALVVLALRPDLDLDAAGAFYAGQHHFIGNTRVGVVARYTAWSLAYLLFVVPLIAWALARGGLLAPRRAPGNRAMLFLALSFAIGPGLMVDGLFKHIAHRPRPYSVTAFDGPERFRPFDRFDGACTKSCSFPSAETAVAAWSLAPASLVPLPWRGLALGAAVLFAAGTGLWRMAFGGHFLSDVCSGALITILVILVIRRVVWPRQDR